MEVRGSRKLYKQTKKTQKQKIHRIQLKTLLWFLKPQHQDEIEN